LERRPEEEAQRHDGDVDRVGVATLYLEQVQDPVPSSCGDFM
jgi:hypothetical protein